MQNGPYRSSHNQTGMSTSGCDPDYGWIPGVDGTKCYMVLKVVMMEGVLGLLFLIFIRIMTSATASTTLGTTDY